MSGIRIERFIWQTTKGLRVDNKHRVGEPLFEAKETPKTHHGFAAVKVLPSAELAAVIGKAPLSRNDAVSKVWDHIRKYNLQNPNNRREILPDAKLRKVLGADKLTMFEMNKRLSKHLKSDSASQGDQIGSRPGRVSPRKKRA
jgi:chromatin remodeling complex protein RSC6